MLGKAHTRIIHIVLQLLLLSNKKKLEYSICVIASYACIPNKRYCMFYYEDQLVDNARAYTRNIEISIK